MPKYTDSINKENQWAHVETDGDMRSTVWSKDLDSDAFPIGSEIKL